MRNVLIAVIMIIAIGFAGCNFTGKSISVIASGPGIYIDDASDTDANGLGRINSNDANFNDVMIQLEVIAANFDNITGFEMYVSYDDSLVDFSSAVHGGVFGSVPGSSSTPDGDYFCPPEFNNETSNKVTIGCAALPTGNYYPVFESDLTDTDGDGYNEAFLQTMEFNPKGTGWADFTIDTQDSSTILAYNDSNGDVQLISLVSGTQTRSVLICQDLDGDEDYNTPECNPTSYVDCDDSNPNRNHAASEACNLEDMDCSADGNNQPVNCDSYLPTILSVSAGSVPLPAAQTFSGTVNFIVNLDDISLASNGQTPLGSDVDRVVLTIDTQTFTDSTNNQLVYTIPVDSTQFTDGVYTVTVDVYDELGNDIGTHTTGDVDVEFYNSGTCTISSISWDDNPISDGDEVNVTVTGNNDCIGRTFTTAANEIRYEECDFGSCTEIVDPTILADLPIEVDFGGLTTATATAIVDWFQDFGDADLNPEIVMVIQDDVPQDVSSDELIVLNIPPTLTVTGETKQIDSAQITFTVSEQSDVNLDYGTTLSYGSSDSMNTGSNGGGTFSLTGLSPITEYFYQLVATDVGGDSSTPVTGNFTTTSYTADFDLDQDVDIFDLYEVASYFRTDLNDAIWTSDSVDQYDLADDDRINIVDLTLVINSYTG